MVVAAAAVAGVVVLGALVVEKGTAKVAEPRRGRSEGMELHRPWVDPTEEGPQLPGPQPAFVPRDLCPVQRAVAYVMPWQKNPFLWVY